MEQKEYQKSADTISGPCREKYWEELEAEAKLERLRQIVKQLTHSVDALAATANDAKTIASDHQHASDGTVLMPVDSFNRDQGGVEISRRDPKYF